MIRNKEVAVRRFQMRPSGLPGRYAKVYLVLYLVCTSIGVLSKPGDQEGYDGNRLIMKLDCTDSSDAQSADTVARQLPSVAEVENCTALPVACWLQCEAKTSAAGGAQAAATAGAEADLQNLQVQRVENMIKSLAAVSPVAGGPGPQPPSTTATLQITAATAPADAAAPQRRPLFSRVGRSRLAYTAVRRLQVEQQTDSVSYPSECSASSCSAMWGMRRVNAPAAWHKMGAAGLLPLTISRPGTMIDTGADVYNNNIKTQMNKKYSRTYAPSISRSDAVNSGKAGVSDHGSHTFCTVAGAWNAPDVDPSNVAGLLGPAEGKLLSCNAFGTSDGASVSNLVKCMSYAVQKKSHWVVNMSVGAYWQRNSTAVALMRDAMQVLCDNGAIVTVAAANSEKNVDDPKDSYATYPAAFAGGLPCVIAVAAIDNSQNVSQLAYFSNWGTAVKIAAPGVSVTSCYNSYSGSSPWASGQLSGTSMATPHVAGAAMLLMNAFPNSTNLQVIDCLLKTATDPVGYANTPGAVIGGGVLDVNAAYTCMLEVTRAGSTDVPQSTGARECNKDTLQDCELAGLCTARQGCRCSPGTGADCTCNAKLGFTPYKSAHTGISQCRWNVTFRGNRNIEVPLKGQVTLPIPLAEGFCPASGVKVVDSVVIKDKTDCPNRMQQKLPDTAAAGMPLGESCGHWVMNTSTAGATAGSCYRVRVVTTDRRSYNLVFKYY